jgi:hypothetical protein
MAANLVERSNHQRIGAPDLPSIQYPSPAAEEPRVEVGDVALPSSFEGRGELKKRTNFI